MAKIVIFGVQDFAQLAHFYLTREGRHEIVAFAVHRQYIVDDSFMGLPVVPFESLVITHPPKDFQMFVPMSSAKMNSIRQGVYEQIKAKGYRFVSYISPRATYYGTPIGENCFIFENNVIQPFTSIGNNVVMWSGNHFGHHSSIADHCFIASHVVISGHVTIGQNCFVGVNAQLIMVSVLPRVLSSGQALWSLLIHRRVESTRARRPNSAVFRAINSGVFECFGKSWGASLCPTSGTPGLRHTLRFLQ